MKIIEKTLQDIKPYNRNPRKNDQAVEAVAESIREFGFKVPIIIDKDSVIVAGHTRYKAAQALGMAAVPCIEADDLTPEQVRAFRLADNKVGEIAEWNADFLVEELKGIEEIDMSKFAFDISVLNSPGWFQARKRNDNDRLEEESEEYQEFVRKFEQAKTTDDCYTPDIVYDAVARWVEKEYNVRRERFARPFYPGGGLQKQKICRG